MRSTGKPCSLCGGKVIRVTSDATQDRNKVARWQCTHCKKTWSQRLRGPKGK